MPVPTQSEIIGLFKLIRPWSMGVTKKIRVGCDHDGGYVLPATVLQCDAIVSVGIGPDESFDFELAEKGARILQYDHTIEDHPLRHPNFIFHKKGWGVRTEGDFISFDDIFEHLVSLNPKKAMLKFDIEGGEYEVIEAMKPEHLAFFDVLACEFHKFERLGDRNFFESVKNTFEKLYRTHVPVHLHANNALTVSAYLCQGVLTPTLLEVSYLRRDLDQFPGLSTDPIPGPLDRPNNPGIVDLCLNVF